MTSTATAIGGKLVYYGVTDVVVVDTTSPAQMSIVGTTPQRSVEVLDAIPHFFDAPGGAITYLNGQLGCTSNCNLSVSTAVTNPTGLTFGGSGLIATPPRNNARGAPGRSNSTIVAYATSTPKIAFGTHGSTGGHVGPRGSFGPVSTDFIDDIAADRCNDLLFATTAGEVWSVVTTSPLQTDRKLHPSGALAYDQRSQTLLSAHAGSPSNVTAYSLSSASPILTDRQWPTVGLKPSLVAAKSSFECN